MSVASGPGAPVPTRIRLSAHAPERRRRPVVLAGGCCSSCCCCCCCCLHTLGGLIGASTVTAGAVVSKTDVAPDTDVHDQAIASFDRTRAWYWISVLVVSFLLYSVSSLATSDGMLPLIGLLLALPLFQLLASAATAVLIPVLGVPDARVGWKTLGQITLRSIVGFVLGTIIMAIVGGIGFALMG